jgi:type IV pilus assembly protein PilQ
LEIHPEDSSGSVRPVGNAVLPTETTTEVTTTVLVRDGHTIIIGGLFREESKSSHTQIPLAGSIPYLGALFRQTTDNTVRDEVIILITPRIIKQPVDEAVSEQLKDDVERFRIGARKGLMWIDHDKMAQTCMRVAKFWLAEGKHDLALWNVELAMGIQPRSEEAIRLRERLTGRTFWANQPQESSVRYVIQRMVMQEMGKPVERIIPSEKPRDAEAVDPEVRSGLGIDKRPEDPFPRTKLKRTVKPKPMAAPAEPAVGKMPATQPAR